MHMTLNSRDDVDRLYVWRKEEGRGRTSIQDSVDASIQKLEDSQKEMQKKADSCDQKLQDNTTTNDKI